MKKYYGWFLLLSLAAGVLLSCSSKHIQTATSHKDSTTVRTASATTSKIKNRTGTRVATDHSKTKEKVEEVTVVEFDTIGQVGRNGTAEDFTGGIREDAWSLKQARIKRITHTKTTTRQIAADVRDSSTISSSVGATASTAVTDSTHLLVDTKTKDKRVFNWNWLLWLLVIPAGYGAWKLKKYFV
jgi:hypothetical protein